MSEYDPCDVTEVKTVDIDHMRVKLATIKEEGSEEYFDGRQFKPMILAHKLVEKTLFPQQIISLSDRGQLYEMFRYDEQTGLYVEDGAKWLKRVIQECLGEEAKKSRVSDVIFLIQNMTLMNREDFKQPKHIMVLLNGVYDLSLGELVDFAPKYYATRGFPFGYIEDATCPLIDKYLDEVAPTWAETGQTAKQAMYEQLAYLIYDGFPIHRFWILYGGQGSGKTTFINLVESFIGQKNLSSLSLQSITNYQFSAGHLYGKMGNLGDDIGSGTLKDIGTLQWITGGSSITVSRKFMEPITFKYTGKLLFTTNTVPNTYDATDAFYQRALLVNFPNTFRGTEQEDTGLLDKITTQEELSGLFNLCLQSLPALLDAKKFHNEPTLEMRKLNYLKQSDSAKFFIESCLISDDDAVITNKDLYQAYRNNCILHGINVKSAPVFGKSLHHNMGFGVQQTVKNDEGRQTKTWFGVALSEEAKVEYAKGVEMTKRRISKIRDKAPQQTLTVPNPGKLTDDIYDAVDSMRTKEITKTYLLSKLNTLGHRLDSAKLLAALKEDSRLNAEGATVTLVEPEVS